MFMQDDEEKYNKQSYLTLYFAQRISAFQVMGSHGNLSAKIEEQTTETIRNITSSYHKNMESMMKNILSTICDINPEVHPNFRNAV